MLTRPMTAAGDPLLLDNAAQPLDVGRLRLERGLPCHGHFDRLADEPRVLHLALRDQHDERAALRPHLDQPDLSQLDERLAHRLARHAQLIGDRFLGEPLAGGPAAGADRIEQRFVDAVGEVGRNGERRQQDASVFCIQNIR